MDRSTLPPAGVTLTAAAGVLHVAAAAAHADVSLLLAGAFLALAAVQLGIVATARRWPAATAEVLTFTDLAAIGAWVVSRTVGLPVVGTGVEPVELAGVATVALELTAVVAVVLGPRLAGASARLASLAVVASLGAVAVAAPATGHAHGEDHGEDHAPAGASAAHAGRPAAVVQLGPGDFDGDPDLTRPGSGEAMKALMTGAVQPVVITSDGRLLGATSDDPHDTALADAVEARRRQSAGPRPAVDDDHTDPEGAAPHGH